MIASSEVALSALQLQLIDEEEKRNWRRQYRRNRPLGELRDIRHDGAELMRGLGREPDDRRIDTGHAVDDFRAGDVVLAYWWGLWWKARVQYVARQRRSLTLRWEFNGKTTSGYPARLVEPW